MGEINWQDLVSQAQSAGEIPPVGDYVAVVEHAEWAVTSTGKDMLKVRYRIESGPEQGKALFDSMVISPDNPNALQFFFTKLHALGVDPTQFANVDNSTVAEMLIGRRATVKVSHREWPEGSGQQRTQVDSIAAAPGATDRKSTRLNSSHTDISRMPSSA